MTTKRKDLDLEAVDFSDIVTGRKLPPVHPGQILRDEFLVPLGLSVYRPAQALKIPQPRLNDIVRALRGITVDTALRLRHYFGTTPEFWINLQTRHDLNLADQRSRSEIDREIVPLATTTDPGSVVRAGAA